MWKLYPFALLFLFLLSGCNSTGQAQLELRKGVPIEIEAQNSSISEIQKNSSSLLEVYEDNTHAFELKRKGKQVGTLKVKIREIDNGDQLVFFQLKNELDGETSQVNINIPVTNVSNYNLTKWDPYNIERTPDGTTGIDRTTQPIGLFEIMKSDGNHLNFVLSKQYSSTGLTKKYENGFVSQIRQLQNEFGQYDVIDENEMLEINFPLVAKNGEFSEGWFMISDEDLFKDPQKQDSWIKYQIEQYKATNKWLTIGGPIKKLPYSIDPYTKEGYGRNLGVMVDREAIDRYFSERERYFYNLMINSVADLYEYRNEKDTSIWVTEYTSTWLQKAYGLKAPYIDTRHNEFIGLYLHKVGQELQIKELEEAQLHYGDYLLEQIQIGNVIQVGEGLLISDYFSPYDQNQKTHASLNHVLGGANLLLECYAQTNNQKYLDGAIMIRKGIEFLGEDLLRESGDLWYQVNPDLTFGGNDYEQLTLVDLLNHQSKWESIGEERSTVIDTLIRSKVQFLNDNNITLLDKVVIELEKQGFEELLQ